MSTPRNRFHDGCWTCKAKRLQCDRTRPHCLTCTQKGFACEGYEMRLKWGTGIASRGRFAGASQPVETAIPPRPKGRHRDILREERRREVAAQTSTSFSASASVNASHEPVSSESDSSPPQFDADATAHSLPVRDQSKAQEPSSNQSDVPLSVTRRGQEDVRLFREFLKYGINTLSSTTVNDDENILLINLPRLWSQSDALCAVCITIQATLCPRPGVPERFFAHFNEALTIFRSELGNSVDELSDGTFTAGLMLATIGLSRGYAWTMHLHGVYNVLRILGLNDPKNYTPYRRHLFEVMGYLDMPGFAIGRKNPTIGVWRLHCREIGYACRPPQMDSVEFVSGIPRSLLDLFSAVDVMEVTEEDFWDWPGAAGSISQCHLWEAYRLSGVLSIRHPQLYIPLKGNQLPSSSDGSSQRSTSERKSDTTSTEFVATRIISHVDTITQAYLAPDASKDSLILNAIDFPLFMAGIEADVINANPELKAAIKQCFAVREEAFKYPSRGTILLDIMEEWWTCDRSTSTVHDLATSRGLELGLL